MPPTDATAADLTVRVSPRYARPETARSLLQVATSFGPYLLLCAAMYASLALPYWVTLLLAVPTGLFVVRIFIIQHDCGHRSFFVGKRANDALGHLCSLVTFTPYLNWRRQHAGHHGNWNNLDRRDSGIDIYSDCLTVAEFRALPPGRQRSYRLLRHPLVALVLLPPVVFLLLYRTNFDTPRGWRAERLGVHLTNLALLLLLGGLAAIFGIVAVVKVQLPVMVVASIVGVWLFSLQHRFADTHWARQADWSPQAAAIHGSSYLRLPAPANWITGNIGFHHVHHLNARIPNYRLRECHAENPVLHQAPVITLWQGLTNFRYALWDEQAGRMVSFREALRT